MLTDLIAFLLAPENQPFATALAILIALLALEVVTFAIGMPFSHKIDAMLHLSADADAPDLHLDAHTPHGGHASVDLHAEQGIFGTAWDWLNRGRVPLLVLIMIMVAAFGAIGYAAQGIASSIFGFLPTGIACTLAFVLSIPVTRKVSRGIARVVPRDESYVIDNDHLVGRTAKITLGPLESGTIARVRVFDAHGNQHFPWVRTEDPTLHLDEGADVLLVKQQGNEYLAIAANTNPPRTSGN